MPDTLTKLRRELAAQPLNDPGPAGDYAYALAAVLGQIAKDFGPQAAEQYAEMVDFMLINGDEDGLNADVTDAA